MARFSSLPLSMPSAFAPASATTTPFELRSDQELIAMKLYTSLKAGLAGAALVAFSAAAALAQGAAAATPVPNKGDTAWMLVATALVLMMSVPGLALFYGGLVRTKNMASVLTQVFTIVALIGVTWTIYGYSMAFTDGGSMTPWVGGFTKAFL